MSEKGAQGASINKRADKKIKDRTLGHTCLRSWKSSQQTEKER